MERATGIEPATSSLGSWRSTIELRPLREEEKGKSQASPFLRNLNQRRKTIGPVQESQLHSPRYEQLTTNN